MRSQHSIVIVGFTRFARRRGGFCFAFLRSKWVSFARVLRGFAQVLLRLLCGFIDGFRRFREKLSPHHTRDLLVACLFSLRLASRLFRRVFSFRRSFSSRLFIPSLFFIASFHSVALFASTLRRFARFCFVLLRTENRSILLRFCFAKRVKPKRKLQDVSSPSRWFRDQDTLMLDVRTDDVRVHGPVNGSLDLPVPTDCTLSRDPVP